MNPTPIVRPYFARLARQAKAWRGNTRSVQLDQLYKLMRACARTEFGAGRGVMAPASPEEAYDALRRSFPVPVDYAALRPWVMRMIDGGKDLLWPGLTRRFAQSSGTSDGKSKYIPITPDSLRESHYRGAAISVATYLDLYPDSRLFAGKSFILGGSFANELKLRPGVRVGDLSATLIDCINPLAGLVRVPSKKIALMEDWTEKLPALVEAASRCSVSNISGVPSWFLTVLKGILAHTGASRLDSVWPGLEVFFHGGISMAPYRRQYQAICPPDMRYHECYNASEGFFAASDTIGSPAMLMMLGCGTFYEFIPLADVGSDRPRIIPAWEVEEGKVYALLLTSCNGLWRYPVGDTVRIECADPLRITVAGRTKAFINAFGEELMVENADTAIERVCGRLGCRVADYTAAPVYASDRSRGRHEWLIEFTTPPADMARFAAELDSELQNLNSDYQAKRSHGIFLDPLTVVVGRKGVFDDWLASTGKRGGQRKVPRLSNSRHPMDEILDMNKNSN